MNSLCLKLSTLIIILLEATVGEFCLHFRFSLLFHQVYRVRFQFAGCSFMRDVCFNIFFVESYIFLYRCFVQRFTAYLKYLL